MFYLISFILALIHVLLICPLSPILVCLVQCNKIKYKQLPCITKFTTVNMSIVVNTNEDLTDLFNKPIE